MKVNPKLYSSHACYFTKPDPSSTSSALEIAHFSSMKNKFRPSAQNGAVPENFNIFFPFHFFPETVDSRHLKESIERAEFSLNLELWFGEQTTGNVLALASTRTLQLNFHPGRGLHYHLPVLFDYFHLAAVSVGIHASLVALHQPYIK